MRKRINVVVVDDNEAVLSSIREYYDGNPSVNIVKMLNNGKEALNYLLTNKNSYELIILDILLPNVDGIRILEELKKLEIEKKIIVLSSFKDDYTIRKMQTLKASYYMLKPIDMKVLDDRIKDLINEKDEIKLAMAGNIEMRVSTLLHDLGIPSHVRGYKYIRDGILILYASDSVVTLITKDIYPEIAKKYETTSSRVERAIRHAIEISWIRGDLQLMEELFGNSIDVEKSRPTNSEFLTTIADRFKMKKAELVG